MNDIAKVSVIGLGKLGLPLAACVAWKGYPTVAVDVDVARVDAVNRGIPSVYEPGLADLMRAAGERLKATTDTCEAVAASDATFMVVPTPSDGAGRFSLRYVIDAARAIGKALARKPAYHLVVLTSTVMPGDTDGELRPVLEESSRKRCGVDFGLCYSPEFIALGSVIRDFLNPDFVLIGESDPAAGEALERLYQKVCERQAPVARMVPVNAELTKLAVNTFVTTKRA